MSGDVRKATQIIGGEGVEDSLVGEWGEGRDVLSTLSPGRRIGELRGHLVGKYDQVC